MHKRMIPALAFLAVVLAGCNSTDALTPQVDVGNAPAVASTPVTQADTERLATQPVTRQPMPGKTASEIRRGPPIARGADPNFRDTPGSLDKQAADLPTDGGRTAQTSTTPVQQQAETTTAQSRAASVSPVAGSETIRFLPIIGAPVEAVTPLSKQLGIEARANGLTIKGAADASSKYMLKGYFSALSDKGKTVIVYVWDVLDGSGNRLHRIQGQDAGGPASSNPWANVPPATMQAIATKTIAAYLTWRKGNAG